MQAKTTDHHTCAHYEMIYLAVRRQERKSSAEKLGHVAALLSRVGTAGFARADSCVEVEITSLGLGSHQRIRARLGVPQVE